jgi:hypothetical protein
MSRECSKLLNCRLSPLLLPWPEQAKGVPHIQVDAPFRPCVQALLLARLEAHLTFVLLPCSSWQSRPWEGPRTRPWSRQISQLHQGATSSGTPGHGMGSLARLPMNMGFGRLS